MVDKARLEQLLRGAVASDMMLVNLRLRERKTKPPSFLQLLKEIRAEEEYEASRQKISHVVHCVHAKQEDDVKQAEIPNLKSEIKELKTLVASVVTRPKHTTQECAERAPVSPTPHNESCPDSELKALKKQIKRLQQKFDHKVAEQGTEATVSTVEAAKPATNFPRRAPKNAEEHFCYRCGEGGHYAGRCTNPENQAKVIKKLIAALTHSVV